MVQGEIVPRLTSEPRNSSEVFKKFRRFSKNSGVFKNSSEVFKNSSGVLYPVWRVFPPEALKKRFACSQIDVSLKNKRFQRETSTYNLQKFLLTQIFCSEFALHKSSLYRIFVEIQKTRNFFENLGTKKWTFWKPWNEKPRNFLKLRNEKHNFFKRPI